MKAFALVGVLGCSVDVDQRIDIASNELGIVALDTHTEPGFFELRGFDASGEVTARITRRVGALPELVTHLPGAAPHGSEVTATVQGHESRMLSPATAELAFTSSDDTIASFLAIADVTTTLRQEAQLLVTLPVHSRGSATGGGELAYDVYSCPSNYLLTSPIAKQCCWSSDVLQTGFVNGNTLAWVNRYRNPYGTGCRASDGLGSCAGTACYYGPNGFSVPGIYPAPQGSYYQTVRNGDSSGSWAYCGNTFVSSPPGFTYPFFDTSGTVSTNQGCGNGGGSSDGYWDY